MTTKEKREYLVKNVLTRERKNQYTQDMRRTMIENGYGDCSATVWYWYYKLFGMHIGINTEAQIKSDVGAEVAVSITNGIPDESKLKKGDLLFFRGSDDSRTKGVGHVEMYIGNGNIFGHGSGVGGTVKNMKDYCKSRYQQKSTAKLKNKGLILVKRYLWEDSSEMTEVSSVNDIVWELYYRKILTDKKYWLKKLEDDKNVYFLAKNMANYLRKNSL